ncbi:hypothetical protein [Burkholderia anthina]|uniref:hypothetical protein n=1 Tax=Burkholderia anthina TaxID=179879 RepID=UPI00158ACA2C|nr:hypothetical protein [Burkholderia anthina]
MSTINGLAGAAIGPGAGAGYRNGPIQKLVATTAPAFSSYSAIANDYTILVDATTVAFGVVLPPAAQAGGREYVIKKLDSAAHNVTVTDALGANIEGSSSYAITAQYGTVKVQSDGVQWWIISKI